MQLQEFHCLKKQADCLKLYAGCMVSTEQLWHVNILVSCGVSDCSVLRLFALITNLRHWLVLDSVLLLFFSVRMFLIWYIRMCVHETVQEYTGVRATIHKCCLMSVIQCSPRFDYSVVWIDRYDTTLCNIVWSVVAATVIRVILKNIWELFVGLQ